VLVPCHFHENSIARYSRRCREELLILTAHLKAIKRTPARIKAACVVEGDPHLCILGNGLTKRGPECSRVSPNAIAGSQRKATTDCLFVRRMNVVDIPYIEANHHGGIGQTKGAPLLIAKRPPIEVFALEIHTRRGIEGDNLHIDKGKISLTQFGAPVHDKCGKELRIHTRLR
jgi:hypothetical protein